MISVDGPNYRILPAARYEYDPCGNRTNEPGENEYEQPLRFSTKPWDPETGLGCWGYRYYSPPLGRWIGRDPIEDAGAILVRQAFRTKGPIPGEPVHDNVYTLSVNAPADYIDPDGWSARKGGKPGIGNSTPPETQPAEKPAGRGATCGLTIKRSAICTVFPKQPCDYGHEWIDGGGGRWDFPKDYADLPCTEWDRNHPVWEWYAHVKLVGGTLPDGTSCGRATCTQIKACLQQREDKWEADRKSRARPHRFFSHNCINFVDDALSTCCMARGALPTRIPTPFEEARICCERCKHMKQSGCNGEWP